MTISPIAFLLFQAGDSHITRFFVGATLANTIEIIIKQSGQGNAISTTVKELGGLDKSASNSIGVLGKFGSALGSMGLVAGGIVAANIFGKMADGIMSIISTGLDAVGSNQQLEISLKSLLTANNMYQETTESMTVAVGNLADMQAEAAAKSDDLAFKQRKLTAEINTQNASIQEQRQRIIQMADGLDKTQQVARLQEMEVALEGMNRELAGVANEQLKVNNVTQEYETVSKTTVKTIMSQADAFKIAQAQTADLLDFVSKLAVISPFETETVEMTTKYAIAAGMGVDATKEFVPAFLDLAASVGITSENLGFAADQLFQVKKVGKLTEVDLRQLRRIGIDLSKVIGVEMGMSIEEFNAAATKSPEVFDELFAAVTRFSQNTFAGTSKEMATSVKGLRSTINDIFVIGSRTFMRPLVDAATPAIASIISKVSDMVLGGDLEKLGQQFSDTLMSGFQTASTVIAELVTRVQELFAAFQVGGLTGSGGLLAALGLSPETITAISSAVDMVSEILSNIGFEEVIGAITGMGLAIGGIVAGGIIASLVAALGALLTPVTLLIAGAGLLGAAWAGNWFGIQEAVYGAWATIQPILVSMYDWLYTNIPLAVQAVSDVWANTLQPALVQAGAWINENLIPVLNDLNNWLSTNIPVAVKVLADYWTGTLLPALTPVGDWFTNVFTPALQDINTWLVTNLPVALQTAADFWINTLQPAMVSVGDYIINNILPLLESIGNLLNATINKAIEASAGLWQNVLLPAIMKVGNALLDNLQPALDFIVPLLTSLGATVNDEVRPGLQEMAEDVLPVFQKGMDAITEAIKTAIGYFNSLAEAVSSFELPPVLTPGSPPPFAYALMDIASGAKEAGAALKDMMFSTAMAGAKAKGAGNLFGDMLNFGDEGHLKSRGFSDTRARNIKAAYRSALTELWDELSAGTATAMDLEALTKQNAGGWAQFVDSADIAFQTVTERIKTAGSEMAEELRKQMTDRMMAMGQGFASFGDFIVGMLKQQQQPTQDVLANNEKLTQSITNQQTKLADLETQLKQAIIDHGAESEQVKRKREEIAKLTGEIKKNQQAMGKNQAELKKLAKTDVGANIELLQQFLASEQELFKYTLKKDLVGVNFVMMDRITAQEKLNQLLEEQRKEQEKIAALDKAKADLAFLQQQLSLVQLIKDQGLNPADVLGGITLGLNASLGDLLTVTSNVVTAMVDQINEDLQIASPSRLLYNKFKDQVGGAMAMGLGAAKPMLESAVQPFIDPLLSAGDQAMRQTNYYFSQVVNTRATDSSVISDFKTMQMMLGA